MDDYHVSSLVKTVRPVEHVGPTTRPPLIGYRFSTISGARCCQLPRIRGAKTQLARETLPGMGLWRRFCTTDSSGFEGPPRAPLLAVWLATAVSSSLPGFLNRV